MHKHIFKNKSDYCKKHFLIQKNIQRKPYHLILKSLSLGAERPEFAPQF